MPISPPQIRRDTRVFISAVTRELGSTRKLVRKALEDNDYHAIEQDNFPPDYRDLVGKLRERISSCDAVVHIAGLAYGAEPENRPPDAPRRSYTQLEHDLAVELGRPVYVFLTDETFPADPHAPEPPDTRDLQDSHRRRLASTGRDYNPTASIEDLDRKIRSLKLKVERLEGELQQVDQKLVLTGNRLRRWLALVAMVSLAALASIGYVVRQQKLEHQARLVEETKAEAARQEARKVGQIEYEFAERFLQQLLNNKEITAEVARERAMNELPGLVHLPSAQIASLIEGKVGPRDTQSPRSPLDRARTALAKGDFDEVFRAASDEKRQGRELAMLEGTAALARFRQTPSPEWNERALAAFRRAMVLADPNSDVEWEAWTDAATSAAGVLIELARYSEAEPLLNDVRRMREVRSGPNSPGVASVLGTLGQLFDVTDRNAEAEPLLRRSLAIQERSYGPEHLEVASGLHKLAILLMEMDRMPEAEVLYRRSLTIKERSYGPELSGDSSVLGNLATLLSRTNRIREAEPLYRRSLAIKERSDGPEHPNVAAGLNNLATLLSETNRKSEAESLYRRSLAIDEKSAGPDHPNVATNLVKLGALLNETNRKLEAEPLFRRSLAILERSYGPEHAHVAVSLNDLASLLNETNRKLQAEPLFRRSLAIFERLYDPEHPNVATLLNNLAALLSETNRKSEAEVLYRRSLAIKERSYGPEHPEVATGLGNLARLLNVTGRKSQAVPLITRSVCIFARFRRKVGQEHPVDSLALNSLRDIFNSLGMSEMEIDTRIKAASFGEETLEPICPEVDRLLGPSRPVAEVFSSLEQLYRDQGRPGVYFLDSRDPIAPLLGQLFTPSPKGCEAMGIYASHRNAHADAIVSFDLALNLMADRHADDPEKLKVRINRASSLRELDLVDQAAEELSSLIPVVDRLPADKSALKGRARYQIALCRWRQGKPDEAHRLVEESSAAYDMATPTDPIPAKLRQQNAEVLGALRDGKAPPSRIAIDPTVAIEAARARYRAREALAKLGLDQPSAPLLDQVLGPATPTKLVFEKLDRQYREQGKPAVWFLPPTQPIAPHLDQLLGKVPDPVGPGRELSTSGGATRR